MKLIYLALAGGSPEHDENKLSQLETWASSQNPDSRVIWMYGDPKLETPKMSGNDLFVPVTETYENLLEKTTQSLRWVLQNIDFNYLIRTNTSNYFFEPLVREHLNKFGANQNIAGGVVADWRGEVFGVKKMHTYVSGAGIFMTRSSAEIVSEMNSADYANIPDDVAIGHWLSRNNTKFISIPRNDITDFKLISPSPQTRVKSWVDSRITVSRMHEIDRIYKSVEPSEIQMAITSFIHLEADRCRIEKPRRKPIFSLIQIMKKASIISSFIKLSNRYK